MAMLEGRCAAEAVKNAKPADIAELSRFLAKVLGSP